MIIGNLSGGYLAKNNPKVPFILAVACNLIFGALVSMFLRETHVPDPAGARAPAAAPRQSKAKSAPGGAVLRLLRSGRTLRLLTISNVLTSVVDLTWTIRSVMALQRLGMGPAEYGVWESVNGVVLLASGRVTSLMLGLMDVHGFNLAVHCFSTIRQLITAFASRPLHLYLTLIPETFGGEGVRIAALRALHTRAAVAAGMGIGESGAALRTLSGVAGLIATPAFGYVYQMDSSYPWLVAAGFAVLAEVAFAMLCKDELKRGLGDT